jgi:hypothetical protein
MDESFQNVIDNAGEFSTKQRVLPNVDTQLTHPDDIVEDLESWVTAYAGVIKYNCIKIHCLRACLNLKRTCCYLPKRLIHNGSATSVAEVQNIYYLTQEIAQNFQVEITLQQIKDDNVLEQYHLGFECRHRFYPAFQFFHNVIWMRQLRINIWQYSLLSRKFTCIIEIFCSSLPLWVRRLGK